ncbi:hypothetical protein SY83_18635 [Paenibacillus swuensis]|uniref:DUF3939 domain-containing protein n=2 Tax=Paenibacillus swuensis TaxID=1178515 RepID=A0A172TPP7_9BACL|nr:hypothetical protein SY83_18635 [Paenibacillus swuensis]
MSKTALGMMVIILTLLLSGCMYPDERRAERNPAAAKEFLTVVQSAVDTYQKETGLLPLQNSTMETPLYEKYLVDFKQLQKRGYISFIPGNAFESGGTYYYLIINEETKPEVKLMDLISFQKVNEVQKAVDSYRGEHGGVLPQGAAAANSFFWIDYKKLDRKPPEIVSMYTGQTLNLMMHESGRVVIDYAPDLMQLITKGNLKPSAGEDLRAQLASTTPFVPLKSYPYYWQDNEPKVASK